MLHVYILEHFIYPFLMCNIVNHGHVFNKNIIFSRKSKISKIYVNFFGGKIRNGIKCDDR